MTHNKDLAEFLKSQNIAYKNLNIYLEAFTHSSYVNEQRHFQKFDCNERLEYLGDAALQLCCSTYLFNVKEKLAEGNMSRIRAALVREEALAKYADLLNIAAYVRMGKGEEKTGGRERSSLKADTFEALIGALYQDLGFEQVLTFLTPILSNEYHSMATKDDRDFKSKLQEFVQADSKRAISYHIINTTGPAHARTFESVVKLDDMTLGIGTAASKKEAEQRAAKEALNKLATKHSK